MKKILIALVCGLTFVSAQAESFLQSKKTDYPIMKYPGIEINGCEITFEKAYDENELSMHVSNIIIYYVSKESIVFKFGVMSETGKTVKWIPQGISQKDFLTKFKYIRNKCSFAPQ